jgi:peptidoglycan/LPS O-acetylase OafA/YrhL
MAALFSRRLAPPSPAGGHPRRDLALEGLRGLCALSVFYGHATSPIPCLDPVYSPPEVWWWLDMGSVAVLIFFVLSGYVIGLTVTTPFGGEEARGYLGRRLLRLVPVNAAAVLIAWALAPRNHAGTILGNLAFLENYNPYFFGWRVDVIPNNPSLWSLNFEMFYYVAFLAVWRLAPRAGRLFLCLAAGAAAAVALPSFPQFIACYASGGLYWFAGLAIAWLAPKEGEPGNWPSALLLAAVLWPLAPFWTLLSGLHLRDLSVPPVALQRLDILAVGLWLLLALTGRARKWRGRLAVFSLAAASLALLVRFARGDFGTQGKSAFVAYAATIGLAWALVRWNPKPWLLARLAPVGSVSYGLYAVSLALQFGILGMHGLPQATAGSYLLRLALLVFLSFGVAWLLEGRLQPNLRRWLRGPARAGAPPQKA